MAEFGIESRERLATCHPDLQTILNEAIVITDFKVTSGQRGKDQQEQLVVAGASQLHFPNSKHNSEPSRAVDIAPWPIEWPNLRRDSLTEYARKWCRFHYLAGVIETIAAKHKIEIEWGGRWKDLIDAVHFELKGDQEDA